MFSRCDGWKLLVMLHLWALRRLGARSVRGYLISTKSFFTPILAVFVPEETHIPPVFSPGLVLRFPISPFWFCDSGRPRDCGL